MSVHVLMGSARTAPRNSANPAIVSRLVKVNIRAMGSQRVHTAIASPSAKGNVPTHAMTVAHAATTSHGSHAHSKSARPKRANRTMLP